MAFCPQKSEYLFVLALVPVTPPRALFFWPILGVGWWGVGYRGSLTVLFLTMATRAGLGLFPQGSPVFPGFHFPSPFLLLLLDSFP